MEHIAVLGLGIIGRGIAQNLLDNGYPLTVYNRTSEKAHVFGEQGANVANSPREAVQNADVVISIVADDAASREIWLGVNGALDGAKAGAILIESSTISLEWSRQLADLAITRGFEILDCPVAGSKDAAANGELRLLVGGNVAALEKVRSILETYSSGIVHMGGHGTGNAIKLVNNMILAVQTLVWAEGLTLARKLGIDVATFQKLIGEGALSSPVMKAFTARMIDGSYHDDTHFPLQWMRKDTFYALRAGDEVGVPLPTVAATYEAFHLAQANGLGESDVTAIIASLGWE
jgi:3-hydroxyisobutyrate dehydrogenase